MAKRSRSLPIKWQQVALAAATALFISYIVAMAEVTIQGSQAQSRMMQVRAQVDELEEDKLRLEKRLEFVKSDAYVEMVARQELKFSRPGEKVFVPIPAMSPTPTPAPTPIPTPVREPLPSLWQQWLDKLLGPTPAAP